jgi:hypothetical protein
MRSDWPVQQGYYFGSMRAGGLGGFDRAIAAYEGICRDGEAGEAVMSWKIEVVVDDSGEWEGDPWRFETEHEALSYARDLEFRWSAVRDKRVMKSEDPVNQSWPRCRDRASSANNPSG